MFVKTYILPGVPPFPPCLSPSLLRGFSLPLVSYTAEIHVPTVVETVDRLIMRVLSVSHRINGNPLIDPDRWQAAYLTWFLGYIPYHTIPTLPYLHLHTCSCSCIFASNLVILTDNTQKIWAVGATLVIPPPSLLFHSNITKTTIEPTSTTN